MDDSTKDIDIIYQRINEVNEAIKELNALEAEDEESVDVLATKRFGLEKLLVIYQRINEVNEAIKELYALEAKYEELRLFIGSVDVLAIKKFGLEKLLVEQKEELKRLKDVQKLELKKKPTKVFSMVETPDLAVGLGAYVCGMVFSWLVRFI